MVPIATFIVFIVIFIIVIDFFAILFRLTGMPIDKARFQVISLLTSTGYTTRESELISQHPTRRKLASTLMIISYATTVTCISFLVNLISRSLINTQSIIAYLIFIVCGVMFFKSSLNESVENMIEYIVENSTLGKRIHHKYLNFITKHKGYCVCEVYLCENSDLIGTSIKDSNLKDIEVQILSVDKGNHLVNFPRPEYIFEASDKLTVYGNIKNIRHKFH